MVSLRRTLLALALGSAMISRAAAAQHGSTSLVHTVSVTVPPRVKVQLGAFSPSASSAVKVGSVNASTQGLAVSVRATESWVLSIGSNGTSSVGSSPMRWSLDSGSGYSTLSATQIVASGVVSADATAATVFFRNSSVSAAPVVLTLSAP